MFKKIARERAAITIAAIIALGAAFAINGVVGLFLVVIGILIGLVVEATETRAAGGTGERLPEARRALGDLLSQLEISDRYAADDATKDRPLQSVWEIQNGHIRDYATRVKEALDA